MLGDIGQSLFTDQVEGIDLICGHGFNMFNFIVKGCWYEGIRMKIIRQPPHALDKVFRCQLIRFKIHDVGADVADRGIQRFSGSMNAFRCF